jgi:2-dehydro-3-deoxyphosphooctonate aldolase (KDO 8-P synthase)
VAAGADALFVEVHPEPARALSDAGSQMPLARFAPLIDVLSRFRVQYQEAIR